MFLPVSLLVHVLSLFPPWTTSSSSCSRVWNTRSSFPRVSCCLCSCWFAGCCSACRCLGCFQLEEQQQMCSACFFSWRCWREEGREAIQLGESEPAPCQQPGGVLLLVRRRISSCLPSLLINFTLKSLCWSGSSQQSLWQSSEGLLWVGSILETPLLGRLGCTAGTVSAKE